MAWAFTTNDNDIATNYPYTNSTFITDCTTTNGTTNYYDDWKSTFYTTSATLQTASTYIIPYKITYQRAHEIRYDAGELEQGLNREIGRRQELSQEQLHEQELRKQESIKKQKADAEAKERAKILLLEYLDNDNKRRLLDNKPLEIPSKLFNDVKYHIPISHDRIKAWKDNKAIAELCLSVKVYDLPLEDIILAKLLYILHDEENAIRTARHWQVQENLLARLDQSLN